jgi:hypothetical protein
MLTLVDAISWFVGQWLAPCIKFMAKMCLVQFIFIFLEINLWEQCTLNKWDKWKTCHHLHAMQVYMNKSD